MIDSSYLNAFHELESYEEKIQYTEALLFSLRRDRMTPSAKSDFSAFILGEVDDLTDRIPSGSTYREKDELAQYGEGLLAILVSCHKSPAELPEEALTRIRILQRMISRERFLENGIDGVFEEGKNGPEEVRALLALLEPVKEEYHRGKALQGLLHYQAKIPELPEESRALLAGFLAEELERSLPLVPDPEVLSNLELMSDLCGALKQDRTPELLLRVLDLGYANINYYAVSSLLEMGQPVSAEVIRGLAEDRVYANLTYGLLRKHGKTELFPSELATEEYLAASDMVHWLVYPTELGQVPDRIEYLGKIKKKEVYHVFRFLSDSENLGEDLRNVWLLGWSSEEGGTFSHFEPYAKYEKKTPEKTLKNIKRKVL